MYQRAFLSSFLSCSKTETMQIIYRFGIWSQNLQTEPNNTYCVQISNPSMQKTNRNFSEGNDFVKESYILYRAQKCVMKIYAIVQKRTEKHRWHIKKKRTKIKRGLSLLFMIND